PMLSFDTVPFHPFSKSRSAVTTSSEARRWHWNIEQMLRPRDKEATLGTELRHRDTMARSIAYLGKVSLLLLCLVFIQASALGQGNVGINTTGAAPRSVTILDIVSPDKGVLLPRIDLQAANLAAPVNTPANGLMVYNTATTSLVG